MPYFRSARSNYSALGITALLAGAVILGTVTGVADQDLTLTAGATTADANGQDVVLSASDGIATNGNGGNIDLNPGLANGSGADGKVIIEDPGQAGDQIQLSIDSNFAFLNAANVAAMVFQLGGANALSYNGSAVYPGADNSFSSGLSSFAWSSVYTYGVTAKAGNDLTLAADSGQAVIPNADGALALGSSTRNWSMTNTVGVTNVPVVLSIAANQNDYNPWNATSVDGVVAGGIILLEASGANRDVTGITAGENGEHIQIWNRGATYNLVLKNQDTNSTAANRILTNTGADITLAPNEMAIGVYDGNSSRWRMVEP